MKKTISIAVVDDDEVFIALFISYFEGMNVKICSFVTESQIEIEEMKFFDIVFVDYALSWTYGNILITSLAQHISADFALMSTNPEVYQKSNLDNDKISAIIKKYEKESVLGWFQYTKEKRKLLNA
jgi:CheY-like chemotaxis protein